MSAEEAYASAYDQDKPEGSPTGAHEVFALFTWDKDYVDVPVWVVVYEGGCVSIGGASVKATCREESYNSVVDATTGELIISFVDSSVQL
jgi:predicted small secreted protein